MSSTIVRKITEQLRQHNGPSVVEASADGVSVSIEIEHSERYAVGVSGITVHPAQSSTDVRETAERVVQDVQALDGPLSVVEYDAGSGRAIARPQQPDADDNGVSYWEADVRSDETSLRRYRKDHGAPDREAVVEPLMHNTVGRIAEQLADAVKQ